MVVKTEIAYVPGEWNSSAEFDAWLVESVRNDDQSETFVNFVIELAHHRSCLDFRPKCARRAGWLLQLR
jgi:hypothetical protein